MDDLEFRRTVLAEPNNEDPQVKAAAQADPAKQAFINDVRRLDDQIKQALEVEVPDNLAQRLILRQSIDSHNQTRRRNKVHLALAASLAFAVGIAFQSIYTPVTGPNLGTYTLAHLGHEIQHLHNANEQSSLAQINVKLARYGGRFDKPIGKPVFANYCDFDGVTSLHLIYEDAEQNRISVFITPENGRFDFVEEFANEHFFGQGLAYKEAQVMVVGKDKQKLKVFTQKVDDSLNWEI